MSEDNLPTIDPNFPAECSQKWNEIYCCQSGNSFLNIITDETGRDFVSPGLNPNTCTGCMNPFPTENDDGMPMLKTPLNATAQSPWVKIGFFQYNADRSFSEEQTAKTILTMGNISQPNNDEICKAAIKAFQYGWGTRNQGCTCKVTIVDQKGAEFQDWVQRLIKNPEGGSTPVTGANRMVVQFGWYITGGGPADACGQLAASPDDDIPSGQNSSHIICSPPMYFIANGISVHWEGGKFVYELEGTDTMFRSQSQMVVKVFGQDQKRMFFIDAVTELGKVAMPPFRVQFKAITPEGQVVDMKFIKRGCQNEDDEDKGPYDIWRANEKPPLAVIQDWMLSHAVQAKDLIREDTSEDKKTGITMNYDPTFVFEGDDDNDGLPQFGMLTLWAGGSVPTCIESFDEKELNARMKAVYMVNAGACSPVIQFNPMLKWHFNMF